jgi:hypothetical protein
VAYSDSAGSASSATTAGTVTHYASRTDSSWYNVIWGSGNPSHMYSANSVQIRSSDGGIRANKFYANQDIGYYADPSGTSRLNGIYGNGYRRWGEHEGVRYFGFSTGNTSNQKAKFLFPAQWFWGHVEFQITCSYNYANRPGNLIIRYYLGFNPSGGFYANERKVIDNGGLTADGITLGDAYWDSGEGKVAIIVSNRDNAANGYIIRVRAFNPDGTSLSSVIDSMTLSSIYTSDSTAYPYPYEYYNRNVGFGGLTSPSYSIDVSGTIRASGDVIAYSDSRVKENVIRIDNPIEKLKSMRGVTFTRNDQDDKDRIHVGVIAQEVIKVLPEVVTKDSEGMYSVAYGNMAGLFIEAIKEQQTQIEDQALEIRNLKGLVGSLLGKSLK